MINEVGLGGVDTTENVLNKNTNNNNDTIKHDNASKMVADGLIQPKPKVMEEKIFKLVSLPQAAEEWIRP
jgi:hypothetical protein